MLRYAGLSSGGLVVDAPTAVRLRQGEWGGVGGLRGCLSGRGIRCLLAAKPCEINLEVVHCSHFSGIWIIELSKLFCEKKYISYKFKCFLRLNSSTRI